MSFLAIFLRGIAFVPAVIHGIEALFGSKTGSDKKQAALSFIGAALQLTDAIANKTIVDAKICTLPLSSYFFVILSLRLR